MRSRARLVQGNMTVGSFQRAMVASVAAVRCPCSSMSSLSSSGVGGAGSGGRSSSPVVNSQVRHRPDVPLDSAAAYLLIPAGNARAVLVARNEPSTARRVTGSGQASVARPYPAITEPQNRRAWLSYGVGVASVTSSVDGGPIVILPAIISPVNVTSGPKIAWLTGASSESKKTVKAKPSGGAVGPNPPSVASTRKRACSAASRDPTVTEAVPA